jgi:hypothetical protein
MSVLTHDERTACHNRTRRAWLCWTRFLTFQNRGTLQLFSRKSSTAAPASVRQVAIGCPSESTSQRDRTRSTVMHPRRHRCDSTGSTSSTCSVMLRCYVMGSFLRSRTIADEICRDLVPDSGQDRTNRLPFLFNLRPGHLFPRFSPTPDLPFSRQPQPNVQPLKAWLVSAWRGISNT